MEPIKLLRAILPDVLIDNFDVVNFEKSDSRFDIWLDEKKVQMREDRQNGSVISYGFGEYRSIQDFPIRGRSTYLHVRKRKWLDKESGEIFSWEILAEENKAIRAHRARRKAARTRAEKDLVGEWEPERMENGETRPQIMARSRHIILTHKSKWNAQQQERAGILFRMFPRLEQAYNIYLELVDIFNKKSVPSEARLNLARWYNKVEDFGDEGFNKVIETFENHSHSIINYFVDRLTNASAESFNAKIKAFRSQFRGVGDIKFFMYRLATLYS